MAPRSRPRNEGCSEQGCAGPRHCKQCVLVGRAELAPWESTQHLTAAAPVSLHALGLGSSWEALIFAADFETK